VLVLVLSTFLLFISSNIIAVHLRRDPMGRNVSQTNGWKTRVKRLPKLCSLSLILEPYMEKQCDHQTVGSIVHFPFPSLTRNAYIQVEKFIHSELMAFSTHKNAHYNVWPALRTEILGEQGKKMLGQFYADFVQRTMFSCMG